MAEYQPGVCNINFVEVSYRRRVSVISGVIAVAIIASLLLLSAPLWTYVTAYPFILVSFLNVLQARSNFCVMYARTQQQRAADSLDSAEAVTNQSATNKDQARARQMIFQAIIGSFVIQVAFMALSVVV